MEDKPSCSQSRVHVVPGDTSLRVEYQLKEK